MKRFDFFSIGAGIEEWRETESVRGNFPFFCFMCVDLREGLWWCEGFTRSAIGFDGFWAGLLGFV